MICLLLISIAFASKDFESLVNPAPTCDGTRPDEPAGTNAKFIIDITDGCLSYSTIGANLPFKPFDPVPDISSPVTTLATAFDDAAIIKNTYATAPSGTSSLDVLLFDALLITATRGTTPTDDPALTITHKGTLWGVNNIGVAAPSGGGDAMSIELPDVANYAVGKYADLTLLWTANTKEFGLVYSDCVAQDSELANPDSEENYKCIVSAKSANLIERHHTGLKLAVLGVDNFVDTSAVKTHIATYGPIVTTFICETATLNTYADEVVHTNAYYAAADSVDAGAPVTFLVYGWSEEPPRPSDRSSNDNVAVWLVKYLKADVTTAVVGSPLLKIEIAANAEPTYYSTLRPAGKVYTFVTDCTGEPCSTCSAAGCNCDGKCNACPAGATKTTCVCDETMDCSFCAALADKTEATCTCAADCAGCTGFPSATKANCKCLGKCDACPDGATKTTCVCDSSMDCSACAALSDKSTATCTCINDCDGCTGFPLATKANCKCRGKCNGCSADDDKTVCLCDNTVDCSFCADLSDKSTATCTCADDCAGCTGFEHATTAECDCKADCGACPSDANNGSCDCNAADCADCPGTNDGDGCNCTGYCSTCPPNSDNSSCEADPVCNGSVNCDDCLANDRPNSGCICTAKCNACPAGATNTTCVCDNTMDCSFCAALTNKTSAACTCVDNCADCTGFGAATTEGCKCKTGKCSACPEGKVDDGCEADTPDDGALGVKVTMLLAVVAALLAL